MFWWCIICYRLTNLKKNPIPDPSATNGWEYSCCIHVGTSKSKLFVAVEEEIRFVVLPQANSPRIAILSTQQNPFGCRSSLKESISRQLLWDLLRTICCEEEIQLQQCEASHVYCFCDLARTHFFLASKGLGGPFWKCVWLNLLLLFFEGRWSSEAQEGRVSRVHDATLFVEDVIATYLLMVQAKMGRCPRAWGTRSRNRYSFLLEACGERRPKWMIYHTSWKSYHLSCAQREADGGCVLFKPKWGIALGVGERIHK